jgi:hypothetical protein
MMGRPDMNGRSSMQWCAYIALRKYVRFDPDIKSSKPYRRTLPALDPMGGYA